MKASTMLRAGTRRTRTAFAMAVVFAAYGCAQTQVEEASGPTLVEAGRQHLEIIVEAAGELEPITRVDVMSKASGEVVEVLVDTGDEVEMGTLLARIDPRDVQNDYNQAEADYGVASERLAIAEAQLQRSERLLESGVITEQEHEGRDLEYANARANLVRAETSLELARLRLADVTITSPLDGTVLSATVEQGQVISSPSGNVSGGTVLMTIADLAVMQVRTLVSEADVGRIEAGMPATVHVDAFQERSFQGGVEKIEPQAVVEQNVVNFPVIVSLDNREGILKPGMTANVSVLLAERPDAITLPNNAIVSFEELAAAASVLGVPEERTQMDPSVFQELRRGLSAADGSQMAGAEGDEIGASADEVGSSDRAVGDGPPDFEAIRERIESGELSPEELRGRFQGARGGGAGAFARGRAGANVSSLARSANGTDGRPGIVFVEEADGSLSPRAVLVGVTDWSNSEIVAGLDEGERVALIGAAGLMEEDDDRRGFRGPRIPFF